MHWMSLDRTKTPNEWGYKPPVVENTGFYTLVHTIAFQKALSGTRKLLVALEMPKLVLKQLY